MGGVLTHTLIGLISGSIVYHIWKKPEFFLATLVGNTIVDFFKFFFAIIDMWTLDVNLLIENETFLFWSSLTDSWANWMSLGFFAISLIAFLYHHHIIKKKTMKEYDSVIWAFLFGVMLHLILDLVYFETNKWI